MPGLRTLIFDVADLAAARAFYTDVLGHAPYFDQPFYVGFDVGGYELGLRPAEGALQPGAGGATAYLAADDVDAMVARLIAKGSTAREAPADV
ncbi:MAG: bleomycin resistance protein, partial [Deltaproteobacteria bacterium RBG_16_71_12]